jgi:cytochrome c biogenesis protein CcdA
VQAVCILVAIATVHIDNPRGSALAMAIYAAGIAVSVLLIAAHDSPFAGEISVGPEPLLQLLPQEKTG